MSSASDVANRILMPRWLTVTPAPQGQKLLNGELWKAITPEGAPFRGVQSKTAPLNLGLKTRTAGSWSSALQPRGSLGLKANTSARRRTPPAAQSTVATALWTSAAASSVMVSSIAMVSESELEQRRFNTSNTQ